MKDTDNYELLENIAHNDVQQLREKGKSYGTSWRNRGGVGAFMMLARKWDRLENAAECAGYDVFKLVAEDVRKEGVIDDIRDLRRYLLLVESHLLLENGTLRIDVPEKTIPQMTPEPETLFTDVKRGFGMSAGVEEEYRGADHD